MQPGVQLVESGVQNKDVYASSLRESRLHRCCNRITHKDAGLKCLDCKDKVRQADRSGKESVSSLVDVVEISLPIC